MDERVSRLPLHKLYELLGIHTQSLADLEVRAAKYGDLARPLEIMHQQVDTQAAIAAIEAELSRRGKPLRPDPDVPLVTPPLFMAPRMPEGFVERTAELQQLVAAVLDSSQSNPVAGVTAIQGTGGFGKTTLALALCHHPLVRAAF